MLNFRIFRLVRDQRLSVPILRRCFHHEFTQPQPEEKSLTGTETKKDAVKDIDIPGAVSHKYKVFRDEDSTEIFDVDEERDRYQTKDAPLMADEYLGLNLKRGVQGVFDIEDLVEVLRKESAEDIFVCSVPKDLKYVDYMVVCSGRSYRHMLATAEFVRRIFKVKRSKGDILPKIEGEKSRHWMALDLGNIALHIFSPQAREQYDLESLWAIGPEFDKECNKPEDPIVELFERHTTLLVNSKSKKQQS